MSLPQNVAKSGKSVILLRPRYQQNKGIVILINTLGKVAYYSYICVKLQ